MFNVGGGELLVIMLIALIVLGPQRLPDAARQVGKVMSEVRRVSSGFQRELKDAFDASEAEPPARRTEAAPLAAAVAEADADAKAGSTDDAGTDVTAESDDAGTDATAESDDAGEGGSTAATGPEPVPHAPADQPTPAPAGHVTDTPGPRVAPAVADALDEIVTPLGDERAAS
jgi:sec-independent protein translocase protein TatB